MTQSEMEPALNTHKRAPPPGHLHQDSPDAGVLRPECTAAPGFPAAHRKQSPQRAGWGGGLEERSARLWSIKCLLVEETPARACLTPSHLYLCAKKAEPPATLHPDHFSALRLFPLGFSSRVSSTLGDVNLRQVQHPRGTWRPGEPMQICWCSHYVDLSRKPYISDPEVSSLPLASKNQ